ncbi:hypothetical protein P154DRAFT_578756 [Amniculicola lignicola CBS 123094]|uniref:Uncharacterized protein n=1 Tax=Amniculicola lignicola CBS 123094 TaxID=1392246 RepID=A0A6A5W6T7_9PLEO|nr:hypothetical protein P154DRAFT_578756 [Amniculicola lignicola CBS 123094]
MKNFLKKNKKGEATKTPETAKSQPAQALDKEDQGFAANLARGYRQGDPRPWDPDQKLQANESEYNSEEDKEELRDLDRLAQGRLGMGDQSEARSRSSSPAEIPPLPLPRRMATTSTSTEQVNKQRVMQQQDTNLTTGYLLAPTRYEPPRQERGRGQPLSLTEPSRSPQDGLRRRDGNSWSAELRYTPPAIKETHERHLGRFANLYLPHSRRLEGHSYPSNRLASAPSEDGYPLPVRPQPQRPRTLQPTQAGSSTNSAAGLGSSNDVQATPRRPRPVHIPGAYNPPPSERQYTREELRQLARSHAPPQNRVTSSRPQPIRIPGRDYNVQAIHTPSPSDQDQFGRGNRLARVFGEELPDGTERIMLESPTRPGHDPGQQSSPSEQYR